MSVRSATSSTGTRRRAAPSMLDAADSSAASFLPNSRGSSATRSSGTPQRRPPVSATKRPVMGSAAPIQTRTSQVKSRMPQSKATTRTQSGRHQWGHQARNDTRREQDEDLDISLEQMSTAITALRNAGLIPSDVEVDSSDFEITGKAQGGRLVIISAVTNNFKADGENYREMAMAAPGYISLFNATVKRPELFEVRRIVVDLDRGEVVAGCPAYTRTLFQLRDTDAMNNVDAVSDRLVIPQSVGLDDVNFINSLYDTVVEADVMAVAQPMAENVDVGPIGTTLIATPNYGGLLIRVVIINGTLYFSPLRSFDLEGGWGAHTHVEVLARNGVTRDNMDSVSRVLLGEDLQENVSVILYLVDPAYASRSRHVVREADGSYRSPQGFILVGMFDAQCRQLLDEAGFQDKIRAMHNHFPHIQFFRNEAVRTPATPRGDGFVATTNFGWVNFIADAQPGMKPRNYSICLGAHHIWAYRYANPNPRTSALAAAADIMRLVTRVGGLPLLDTTLTPSPLLSEIGGPQTRSQYLVSNTNAASREAFMHQYNGTTIPGAVCVAGTNYYISLVHTVDEETGASRLMTTHPDGHVTFNDMHSWMAVFSLYFTPIPQLLGAIWDLEEWIQSTFANFARILHATLSMCKRRFGNDQNTIQAYLAWRNGSDVQGIISHNYILNQYFSLVDGIITQTPQIYSILLEQLDIYNTNPTSFYSHIMSFISTSYNDINTILRVGAKGQNDEDLAKFLGVLCVEKLPKKPRNRTRLVDILA